VPVKQIRSVRLIQLLLAVALGAVGAWLGFQGVMAADARTRIATPGLISAAVLGPLLALPMLGTGTIAAHNGRVGVVVDNIVGVVLLNLCLLLPVVILCDYGRHAVMTYRAGVHAFGPLMDELRAVPFPLGVWRLDCVLVMALSIFLLPVSLGRWALGRSEGIALAFGYIAYLIASAALVIRL
jgi:Ca2+/Na+ antiporter